MLTLTHRLANSPRNPWPDRPIPITLVITDLDVGGAERTMVALATRLDRARWEPSVLSLGAEGRLAEPLREAGLAVTCLDLDRGRPLQGITRLTRTIRAQRPRLIQSFMFHANVASRLAGRLARVPWIVGGLRVAERQKRWHLLLDRLTAWLGTGSVCVSEGVFRFSCAVGGLKADRLIVIPNGIDPAPYDTAEPLARPLLSIPEGAPLALFVGRFDEQKGLTFLLDAAEQVIESRPDWRLLLVGDGPDRDPILQRIAESPRLAGRVRWLGRRDDIPSLLKSADLLVLPSLWEGMPNVVLEAMAARRPVVATGIEGTEDLVVEGQTGWLVPPSDAPALARALLEAALEPERGRRAGEAGRVRVESHFTLPRLVASYESLWARLLGFEEIAGAVPLTWNSVPASSFVPPPLAPRGR